MAVFSLFVATSEAEQIERQDQHGFICPPDSNGKFLCLTCGQDSNGRLGCLTKNGVATALDDDKPLCTGDRTACDIVKISQLTRGIVAIQLTKNIPFTKNLRLGVPQQVISIKLFLAMEKTDCNGNGSRTTVTITKSDTAITVIPGYLCEARAAWEER
jgi:hypothetical protein